jgi:hypothetical protein
LLVYWTTFSGNNSGLSIGAVAPFGSSRLTARPDFRIVPAVSTGPDAAPTSPLEAGSLNYYKDIELRLVFPICGAQ